MPVQFKPHRKNAQDPHTVALSKMGRYSLAVAANSATGRRGPINNRRTGAPITIAGAFFCVCIFVNGGCAWETFGSAGFPIVPVRQPAHSCHPKSFDGGSWQLLTYRRFARCTLSLRSKFASLPIQKWHAPFFPPMTPSQLASSPAISRWPTPARSTGMGVAYERLTFDPYGWWSLVRQVQC